MLKGFNNYWEDAIWPLGSSLKKKKQNKTDTLSFTVQEVLFPRLYN